MSKLKVSAIHDPDNDNQALSIDTSGNVTVSQGFIPSTQLSHRNLIINGDMRIAQRGTSAVTINSGTLQYPVDRFGGRGTSSAGVFTLAQSSTAPQGFTNSVKATVTTSATPAATDTYRFVQHIEGNNISHLNWGSSNAQSVTLSFKVRSSITGTFGGAIINGDYNRFYPISYTISTADTWTDVSINIDGDTSGTWGSGTNLNLRLSLSLGAGSSRVGTAGSWGSSTYEGASGQTNLIETNSATWYITGVQLEAGSVATPFEHRSYGEELAKCQRYYHRNNNNTAGKSIGSGFAYNSSVIFTHYDFPVEMRTTPSKGISGLSDFRLLYGTGTRTATGSGTVAGKYGARLEWNHTDFTAGDGIMVDCNNTTGWIDFDAEL